VYDNSIDVFTGQVPAPRLYEEFSDVIHLEFLQVRDVPIDHLRPDPIQEFFY
jgi:hypothetical protein